MANPTTQFGKDPRFFSLVFPVRTAAKQETDSNKTYTTTEILGGIILRKLGASRTDTLPTAAALAAAIPGAVIGTSVEFLIVNTSTGAYTITVASGSTTGVGVLTIAQNASKRFVAVFTAVASGSEAYTLYA